MKRTLNRREFLKISMAGFGLLAVKPKLDWLMPVAEVPQSERLGRIAVGMVNLRARPSSDSPSVGKLYADQLVQWNRDIVGDLPAGLMNRKWIETPNGYLYMASVQPVKNIPNQPLTELPEISEERGMWVEVTVPYVDLILANPPARGPWLEASQTPRIYYSQVVWVDDIRTTSDGKVQYRLNERYGNPGDIFWAAAEGFRPVTQDEITPISPEVADKRIEVSVTRQTLSCYEGNREVYFCRVSTGAKFDDEGRPVDKWATPLGPQPIWRKLLSIHMAGGTTGAGWDTMGIAWTSLFSGDGGAAIHAAFWHNNFGVPVSHGCVNCSPEDAKWIFRWSTPGVTLHPGDITVSMPGGTIVNVTDG
jgi:lipoprotein-anchoring transpeptidase ErfK/SrfK